MPNPYQQDKITDELRLDIVAGKFAPGSFLPSGRVLAARFGVARNTVLAGLAPLVEEGLVQSLPKRGYQVMGAPTAFEVTWTQDGQVLPAGEQQLGAGKELRTEVRHAPADVAGLLQGPEEMTVVVRSTVHRHAGVPWALREFHVPRSVADIVRRLSEPVHVDELQSLAEHDLAVTGLRSRWSTRAATTNEAQLLKSGSSPVHVIQRTGFHDSEPVFCELMTVRADRVFLSQSSGSVSEVTGP
ncbi:GntR family transcriptional regulator [Streptomyces sp. NPDC048270]|uniref:GntR family transcriptional regulator n=1 Tax=Streptomyces sp. NPDC048270 TaxID=3154615 RepID=UPI0033F6A165